jgi:geranylgeranyl reductase family protein
VLVVGGGPAGSASAILLRRLGHDVLLIDEARFPRDKVCGEAVSPGAWPLLAQLGVESALQRLGPCWLRGMVLHSPNGTSFRGEYGGAAPGFAIRRDAFDQLLLQAARGAGVEVREGVRARDVVTQAGAVCGVVTDDGRGPVTLRARIVVGADGRRSVVGRKLGLLREHRRLRRFSVRGHWDGVAGLGPFGEMHVAAGGYCGIAPLSPSRANVAFVLDRGELAAAAGDLEGFYRGSLARRWPRISERLEAARLLAPPRAIGPLALEARRVAAPGVMLVGDAAGFYDPFTGEGITLALRSAQLAAETADRALRAGRPAELWDYEHERLASTRAKFRFNELLQAIVRWPRLSDAVARRLARRPDLADRLVGIAGDFVPARRAFEPSLLRALLLG